MPINETKLNEIAAEWDPLPFLQAVQNAAAPVAPGDPQPGGAMDMGAGGGFAEAMGLAPGGPKPPMPGAAPMSPEMMKGLMPQQPSQGMPMAPSVAPRGPGPQMQFPGMPKIGKIPTLAEILGGS